MKYSIIKDEIIVNIPPSKVTCWLPVNSRYVSVFAEEINKILNIKISLPMNVKNQLQTINECVNIYK